MYSVATCPLLVESTLDINLDSLLRCTTVFSVTDMITQYFTDLARFTDIMIIISHRANTDGEAAPSQVGKHFVHRRRSVPEAGIRRQQTSLRGTRRVL